MPIKEYVESAAVESLEQRIADTLRPVIRNLASVEVSRPGRSNRRWRKSFDAELGVGEDAGELAKQVAARMVALAEEHTGDKTQRYTFSFFGRTTEDRHAPVLASPITEKVGPDVDDDNDDDDTPPNAVKASASIVRDMGERHMKLLSTTLDVLDRVAPMVTSAATRDAAVIQVEANTRLEIFKLEMAERQEQREAEASAVMWQTINELSNRHKPLLDALAMLIVQQVGKAAGK